MATCVVASLGKDIDNQKNTHGTKFESATHAPDCRTIIGSNEPP